MAFDVARAGTGTDQLVDVFVAVTHRRPFQAAVETTVHFTWHAIGAAPVLVVDTAIIEAVGIDRR